jgi:hypothetical protein
LVFYKLELLRSRFATTMIYRLLRALYPKSSKNSKRTRIIESIGTLEARFNKQFLEITTSFTRSYTTKIIAPFVFLVASILYLFVAMFAVCICIAAYLADITPILFSTIKTYKR